MNIAAHIKQHQARQPACGNCAHWTRHEDVRMAEHGHCAHRRAGHYSHHSRPCHFSPSRFNKKS